MFSRLRAQMAMRKLPEAVAYTALVLDEFEEPCWAERIDLERLDTRSGRDCVIAQLHDGSFPWGIRYYEKLGVLSWGCVWSRPGRLNDVSTKMLTAVGACGVHRPYWKWHERLTKLWTEEIEARRQVVVEEPVLVS